MLRYGLLFFVLLAIVPGLAEGTNSCVRCHAGNPSPALKEAHAEWKGSIHSRMGITCENCHGGDPNATEKVRAHDGVYDALNPESSVYYTRIPRLCGECHKHELIAFKRSRHFEELMDKGVGPNCVTCHDAMATKVLKPGEVELFCGVCHNARNGLPDITGKAGRVLTRMQSSAERLRKAERILAARASRNRDCRRARGFLNLAGHELFATREDWHAFQLDRVLSRLSGVDDLIRKGLASLPSPPAGSP